MACAGLAPNTIIASLTGQHVDGSKRRERPKEERGTATTPKHNDTETGHNNRTRQHNDTTLPDNENPVRKPGDSNEPQSTERKKKSTKAHGILICSPHCDLLYCSTFHCRTEIKHARATGLWAAGKACNKM